MVYQLSLLINGEDPRAVMDEVKALAVSMKLSVDFKKVEAVFDDVKRLFDGNYPDYRKCNTLYHDLKHTTDVLLAVSRLMHGAFLAGKRLSGKNVGLTLIAALLHDTGYIQPGNDDEKSTGAKYTLVHISRSIEFMERYFHENGYSQADLGECRNMISCTGLDVDIKGIRFSSAEAAMQGRMLGTADLLGQMADRIYLEKLLYLFGEFREGMEAGYASELSLLKNTLAFYEMAKKRLAVELGGVEKYLLRHFNNRWKVNANMYTKAVEQNMDYLRHVLSSFESEYRKHLRRGNVVKRLQEMGL